ncbi:MAG: SDR family NAD(P)-dependent oxidoreductase [Gemmataceae bacterium]
MHFQDQVIVVTGAASGIGRAVCRALAHEGACLGLLDRDAEGLDTLVAELRVGGTDCAAAPVDVRDRFALHKVMEEIAAQLGPVDIVIASAGISAVTLVDDLDVEMTEKMIQVNLMGVANTIDAVLPSMLARGTGHIVGIASLAGRRGMPFSAAYCASKAGLIAYLDGLRPGLRQRGILVTTILPGFVRTPLMERDLIKPPVSMMTPEQAAGYVVWAIHRRKRVYAFPFTSRCFMGMLRWLPAAVHDWLMVKGAELSPHLKY